MAAAVVWTLFCVRWFDVAAAWRPTWLQATPPWLLGLLLAAALAPLLASAHRELCPPVAVGAAVQDLWLMAALGVAFRLPMAWTAAAGYTSADGSLSGVVALRVREGLQHLVFVPSVPYSGSLKSHLTAALAEVVDIQRAFALCSIVFYGLFVAALYGLGALLESQTGSARGVARRAALYAIFAPAFITRYSLSNDGNYVEVLALGTYALLLAAWSTRAESDHVRDRLAWIAGLALGLAFWCHILAIIHAAAVGLIFAVVAPRKLARTAPRLAAGTALGYMPGLLWNAGNGWDSFAYLLGGQTVGAFDAGPPWPRRLWGILSDQWPVLAGYDVGFHGFARLLMMAFAGLALLGIGAAFVRAVFIFARTRDAVRGTMLLFTLVNMVVAVAALPYIPLNARYLLFLVAPVALFLGDALDRGVRGAVFGLIVAGGALTSLHQWPAEMHSDERWRSFVRDLQQAGITRCYTDFFLAAKINFVSEERVVCSSELGPTTTEYFPDYRPLVARSPRAALIAVNAPAAEKLERKLGRLGVGFQRLDLMKPVLVPERRVSPAELFSAARDQSESAFSESSTRR
jgi:hypothetical protein